MHAPTVLGFLLIPLISTLNIVSTKSIRMRPSLKSFSLYWSMVAITYSKPLSISQFLIGVSSISCCYLF